MGSPLLELDAFCAGYQKPVVGPVSLRLERGEVVGLAGPNGSGKSTLLRAVVGAARAFGGSLMRAPRTTLALQSQYGSQPRELPMTGGELLRLMRVAPERLPQRLRELAGYRLDQLSGGQRQLFMVWAALGQRADIVLLDEPTNNLDLVGMALLAHGLKELESTRAALVVSHEVEFLRDVCDRVIELSV